MNKTYMNKTHLRNLGRKATAAVLVGSLFLSGCTKKFESLNTDNTGIPNNLLKAGSLIIGMELNMFGEQNAYQLDQNLNADCYTGYMMSPDPFRGNINNLSYALVDGWDVSPWQDNYTLEMGYWLDLKAAGVDKTNPDQFAVATILKVEGMDRLTDKFGACPYTSVGSVISNPYDDQATVYKAMFADLDTATAALNSFIAANPGVKPLSGVELVYNGDYTEWVKFANSLRLRLAMHIVKADAATAQAQATTAVNATGGLMTVPADDATITGGGYVNPLNVISTSWTDISMGADFESIMVGYNDPRLAVMASPSTVVSGQYIGIRLGAAVTSKPGYTGFSILNTTTCVGANSPMTMMTAAEVYFLEAEAALRNWSGFSGSAQSYYEAGITTSFTQWKVSGASAYIANATAVPINYVDPVNNQNNASAAETITIAWDNAATNEENLERIETQKWIAMFPEGQEAWTEQRRTGYPHLFVVANNNSAGLIPSVPGIRRLAYPSAEYNTNGAAVAAAVSSTLGGKDNGGTRLWWDTGAPNF